MSIVDIVARKTSEYTESVPKSERKEIGQFFTPPETARQMAGYLRNSSEEISILDPGAGTGILTAAALEKVLEGGRVRKISADLFETNKDILPVLSENMEMIRQAMADEKIDFSFSVISEDFITHSKRKWMGMDPSRTYDIAISNPPYMKIGKGSQQAEVMRSIVYGQPNLYCLFMAMASKLLKDNGELIFIVPRSFTSGLYFSKFREWFLDMMKITDINTFESRDSTFTADKILQETVIVRALKTKNIPQYVTVSESRGISQSGSERSMRISHDLCISDDGNRFILIPTKESDVRTIHLMKEWGRTLPELGYKLKTGQVIDFRETDWLRTERVSGAVPLIWPCNFEGGNIIIRDSLGKKPQYFARSAGTERVMLAPGNYVLVKRFTSKEEPRRIQCAVLPSEFFERYGGACVENHVNILTKRKGNMSTDEMMGLYVLFSSSYYDDYYRLLNGSTQVNATEFNSMCSPPADKIAEFGTMSRRYPVLDAKTCDMIIDAASGGIGCRKVKEETIWENWMRPKIY